MNTTWVNGALKELRESSQRPGQATPAHGIATAQVLALIALAEELGRIADAMEAGNKQG
ncbi:hypothetical protein [Paractinoplanes maris]|uniref:hypothetical protein n=1 Tax=Paractinoplanes maris TaxID=1734446 RepID=UPI002020842B|nr:hypothetical protein [Actinoplanes maris]